MNLGIFANSTVSAAQRETLGKTAPSSNEVLPASTSGTAGGPGAVNDTVSLSKLGQALTGQAADVFRYLDPKARGALDDLVTGGRVSVDDVVTALKGHAKFAAFGHDAQTANPTSEQAEASTEIARLRNDFRGYRQESMAKRAEISALTDAREAGQVGDADFLKQVSAKVGEMGAIAGKHGQIGDDTYVLKATNLGADAFASAAQHFITQQGAGSGSGAIASRDELAAMSKLGSQGFDQTVYRDAFARYAADASRTK